MNPWLYAFLLSIIVFLLLKGGKNFARNLWAGLICAAHQLGTNILAYKLNFWNYLRVNEGLPNFIVLPEFINIFIIGIGFTMGMLFVQFLPRNYLLQLIHACVWTLFFRLLFQITKQNDMIYFIHWKVWMYFYIIPVNMLTLVWIKNIISERLDINKNANRNSA